MANVPINSLTRAIDLTGPVKRPSYFRRTVEKVHVLFHLYAPSQKGDFRDNHRRPLLGNGLSRSALYG